MMTNITKILIKQWDEKIVADCQQKALENLEEGHVILFPNLAFALTESEKVLLSPDILQKGRKNISYNANFNELKGVAASSHKKSALIQEMMQRFFDSVKKVVSELLPSYENDLIYGRTSYRPAEIFSRQPLSAAKDDRCLHVDAFPATPVANKRILRVFSNINPNQAPRCWRLGKSFQEVIDRYLKTIPKPLPGVRKLKQCLGITRGYQTLYDHYMLKLHHTMKLDHDYQNTYPEIYDFSSQSSWMVYTDVVPHAAMSGQYLLEQTIYVPIGAMQRPEKSPLKLMEQTLNQSLLKPRAC